MTDIIDRANERAAEILDDAFAAHFRNRPSHDGSDFCISCGEMIPPARRVANPFACRCVDCQNDHDRWERQYA